MSGLTLAAAASIAVGLSIGAAATVGVTLASEAHFGHSAAPAHGPPVPSGPDVVEYGDRCLQGHCLPCDSKERCPDELPAALRP